MLALAGAMAAASFPVAAADLYTAGDSHCREIARLLGWKTVARDGAKTAEIVKQLARVPLGAFVLVCSGTNDSENAGDVITASIYADAAMKFAAVREQRLVWVGPSAVRRDGWSRRVWMTDITLRISAEQNNIPYLSISRDPAMQPADDVHLRAVSYRALGATGALLLQD